MLRPLKSFDIKGQTILVRLDLNVPIINGVIQDDFRIKACLPTINYFFSAFPCRVQNFLSLNYHF